MRVLTSEEMRAIEREVIEGLGIPSLVLMEHAAIGVVDAIAESFPEASSAAIFCGPGNNGGDGLAIARLLEARGYEVAIFLMLEEGRALEGDAGRQLTICERLGLPITVFSSEGEVGEALAAASDFDLLVDALFGTGLSRPLSGLAAAVVEGLNTIEKPRIAVDLPSGLSGSRADLFGPHVLADLTVTFAAPKVACVLWPAAEAVGELAIADLGFPARWIEPASGGLHLSTEEDIAPLLPGRDVTSHKGRHGHALIVAGSPGKSGAAVLAARAAVRAGAGLVTVAVPEPIASAVDSGSVESMTLGLAAGSVGEIAERAVQQLLAAAEGKRAVALGPGLGQGSETQAAIRAIARALPLPLVLDADGLNAFAGCAASLRERSAPTILTPHSGELARLLETTSAEIEADRLGSVARAAEDTGAVVILKGHRSLIASSGSLGERGREIWINPTGNAAMATGGSGDVLTGLLVALLAQGVEAWDAARLGVYLHGLAGDLGAEATAGPALPASALVDFLGAAWAQLAQGR